MHAISSYHGNRPTNVDGVKADEKTKLQSVLYQSVPYGFLTNCKPVEYLFESSDTIFGYLKTSRPCTASATSST